MTLHPVVEATVAALLLVGAFFLVVGAIGFVRFPDFFMRQQAPAKSSTLGVGGVLAASIVAQWAEGGPALREILIGLFLLVTAPVSAHLLAQAALHLEAPSIAPLPEEIDRR
jgi:multicomponent K+:H+ antiporter subunit G